MHDTARLRAAVPGTDYHRDLISCQMACPVHTDARGYVRAIADGDFERAYLIARGPNPFASICGRVCGAPCEAACRRGRIPRVDDHGNVFGLDRPIAIRALKRFACEQFGPDVRSTDEVLARVRGYAPDASASAGVDEFAALLKATIDGDIPRVDRVPVAIVGAGPAGLSAAHDLALLGFTPVVFEAEPVPAGMLALGVPAYRLPRDLITREVRVIEALGVEIRCNTRVGRDVSMADLRRDHAAVIIAVGAKGSRGLGLPGERGPSVFGGVDLLRSVSLGEPVALGREVVVIGGGNVAYDVARTVLRQIAYDTARTAARQAETTVVRLVSLESLEEMPADTIEILEGDEEGIERLNGWGPLEIARSPSGAVTGVRFRRCLRVYDEAHRFAPVYDDADVIAVPGDTVLLAVGQMPDLGFLQDGAADVAEMRPGWPKVDQQSLETTAPGVFVAGDLAHGTKLLIHAVASGKAAARSVYGHVTGRMLEADALTAHLTLPRYRREPGYERIGRVPVPAADPAARLLHPEVPVELGYTRDDAMREASRCLDCGVTPVFDGTRCVLCGGCVDVCPTECLKLVTLASLDRTPALTGLLDRVLGSEREPADHSAILKDEDRCIRCALCVMRCPVDAIAMDRVTCTTTWRAM
ncbi:MAG TPA: FAD-dependent oxidoreductase [Vicinamibacterales bacterium]|nr:FAD-dependent oxidoreductase [Vicinamibacterales bacterium]